MIYLIRFPAVLYALVPTLKYYVVVIEPSYLSVRGVVNFMVIEL